MYLISKRIINIFLITAGLLLIPFISMQFSAEVNWTAFDFLIAGILLLGTGFTADLIWFNTKTKTKRNVLLGLLIFCLLLFWAELAVGVFGSPFAGS